jgi:signal transduction histidine kinase
MSEIASLQENVDHIRAVVTMQQTYATAASMAEPLDPAQLMEDALRIKTNKLGRDAIHVERVFQPTGPVRAEKAKVLQILINLISNARQACVEGGAAKKVITLGIETSGSNVRFRVQDNGIGIAPENLTRIFGHGFTTKANGHGFGLHSAANAAKEMKGSLTAVSLGQGAGATFVLELPLATTPTSEPADEIAELAMTNRE